MKKNDSKSTSKAKPKAPAGKASPTKAKKVASKAAKAKSTKPKKAVAKKTAVRKVTAKKAVAEKGPIKKKVAKKAVAKKAVAKKAVAKKPAKRSSRKVAKSVEPIVPKISREQIADAAYFRSQKRIAYGHCPDPVADWVEAEAELLGGSRAQ